MADSGIEIYVGDVPLVERSDSAAASSEDLLNLAAEKLSGIGGQLTKIFSAMHPSKIATTVGAEEFDLEIGFSIEAGPGGLLKLVISPKVGMSCKATMRWKPSPGKKSLEGEVPETGEEKLSEDDSETTKSDTEPSDTN
jgi:hypothetical protein